jgi:hypothetical protein
MNHWMWPVSLVGILSTAVVCGTGMFFLTVGRPALRLASPFSISNHPRNLVVTPPVDTWHCGHFEIANLHRLPRFYFNGFKASATRAVDHSSRAEALSISSNRTQQLRIEMIQVLRTRLFRRDDDRLSLLHRVGDHKPRRPGVAGIPGDSVGQVRGIDEALTFFDRHYLVVGKGRKDRSTQHIPHANYRVIMAASIGAR